MKTFEISCHAHPLRSISSRITASHAQRVHSPPIQQPISEFLPQPQPSLDILPRAASSPLPPLHTIFISRHPLPLVSTYLLQPLVASHLPLLRVVLVQLRRRQQQLLLHRFSDARPQLRLQVSDARPQLRLQVSDARPQLRLQLKAYSILLQLLASSALLQLPQFLSSTYLLPQCAFASPVQG